MNYKEIIRKEIEKWLMKRKRIQNYMKILLRIINIRKNNK